MTKKIYISEAERKMAIVSITDFLRDQVLTRVDFCIEDRYFLTVAIISIETDYELEGNQYILHKFSRPLMDIFRQLTNPVRVEEKILADYHKVKGNDYIRRREFENAKNEYIKAIELDKWNAIYYANCASAKIEQRRFLSAIADCRQALMLNPDYAKAHTRMGHAFALLHDPIEAARCFRQALELEPENERYLNNLRIAEYEINRHNTAQIINNCLGCFSKIKPQNTAGRISRTMHKRRTSHCKRRLLNSGNIPEKHPPAPGTLPQTFKSSEIYQITPVSKSGMHGNKASMTITNCINTFPCSFGATDENSEDEYHDALEEFFSNIPSVGFDANTTTQSSSTQAGNSLQN